MSILSDTDRAKFKAEFGRDPRGPEDALSLRLESYRADVLSTPSETLAEAAKLLPFHPEDSPSPRAYLTKLARHFKDSLFTWVSQPACSRCGLGCAAGTLAYGEPTAAEAALGCVRRVEVWACGADGCGGSGRFPRYRDAGPVLLRTRRGRCGEWAKAFFLLCRASRTLDVRLVYDWTDHVWVEALLAPKEGDGGACWTHCDVCEGVVGDGKMYERDWGKKLNWILRWALMGGLRMLRGRIVTIGRRLWPGGTRMELMRAGSLWKSSVSVRFRCRWRSTKKVRLRRGEGSEAVELMLICALPRG